MSIKPASIVRAGYEYQDLVGIETLIRFFRDPSLYEWIEIESEDPAASSIDDILAKRSDGGVEYTQVKFTVDPERFALDWDWLLERKAKGSSRIAKWAAAVKRGLAEGPIHSAELHTNRRASSDFAACLSNRRVDLALLNAALRTRVEGECGGAQEASDFFARFDFVDGLSDLDGLEARLRDTLVPTDTDALGWLLLRHQVRRWATNRHEPAPDGRVRHQHLLQIITRKRSQPIRQDFRVPEGYEPPNAAFDTAVHARLLGAASMTLLWGTPGRGKSTYLSHLTAALQDDSAVVLRHHYFLAADEDVNGRISFVDIATSLFDQLAGRYPNLAEGLSGRPDALRDDLTKVADKLRTKKRRLYLIVDGLDHVGRDTGRLDQLAHLFNILLPLPGNIHLIVGTQRVADSQLPSRLMTNAASEDWIEIPAMDETAVHRWLYRQDEGRALTLPEGWKDRREQLDEIAAALFKSSDGHPLHLIYALESLILSGSTVTASAVELLPTCPDGDIRKYYASLWARVGTAPREMLHGLAGSDFFWPEAGLRECFGPADDIAFLLQPRQSGMMPFHASLFAWIRDRGDHAGAIAGLLPRIARWLEESAPPYWNWGWHWLVEARRGNPAPLLAGATRPWAVESLAAGWPDDHIETILKAAERVAFDQGDYALAIRQRTIKTRVSNVQDFQARDFGLFQALALAIADNRQQIYNLIDGLVTFGDDELAPFALYAPPALANEVRPACLTEFRRRINAWIALRHRRPNEFEALVRHYIACAARAGTNETTRVMNFLDIFKEPKNFQTDFIDKLAAADDAAALRIARAHFKTLKGAPLRRLCDTHMLRIAWRAGADPGQFEPRPRGKLPPLLAARAAWKTPAKPAPIAIGPVPDGLGDGAPGTATGPLESFFSEHFWATLYAERSGDHAALASVNVAVDAAASVAVAAYVACLREAAKDIAAGKLACDFAAPFIAAADIRARTHGESSQHEMFAYMAFRKSLSGLAFDLDLLGGEPVRRRFVEKDPFETARASSHWSDELFLEHVAAHAAKLLSTEAAESLINGVAAEAAESITQFDERAQLWTLLGACAHVHGLGAAAHYIARAADSLLAYGYRKDLSAFDTLDAIETVSKANPAHGSRWIAAVAPIVDAITSFTDGDETNHVRSQLVDTVAAVLPEKLPGLYRHHMRLEEWDYADMVFRAMTGVVDLDGPAGRALAATILDERSLGRLERRGAGNPAAAIALARQLEYLGGVPPAARRFEGTPDMEDDPAAVAAADPKRFAPAKLEQFLVAADARGVGYRTKRVLLAAWPGYWAGKGKAVAALKAIDRLYQAGQSASDLDHLFDAAFDTSLQSEGPDAAYKWLVRAHIYRHGWSSNWTSESEVLARLGKAAAHYRDRWREFIADSAKLQPYWEKRAPGFSLGQKYLVRFLVMVGEIDLAASVTDALVASLVDEVRDQPIRAATWLG